MALPGRLPGSCRARPPLHGRSAWLPEVSLLSPGLAPMGQHRVAFAIRLSGIVRSPTRAVAVPGGRSEIRCRLPSASHGGLLRSMAGTLQALHPGASAWTKAPLVPRFLASSTGRSAPEKRAALQGWQSGWMRRPPTACGLIGPGLGGLPLGPDPGAGASVQASAAGRLYRSARWGPHPLEKAARRNPARCFGIASNRRWPTSIWLGWITARTGSWGRSKRASLCGWATCPPCSLGTSSVGESGKEESSAPFRIAPNRRWPTSI